jgi:hypothetical protein
MASAVESRKAFFPPRAKQLFLLSSLAGPLSGLREEFLPLFESSKVLSGFIELLLSIFQYFFVR